MSERQELICGFIGLLAGIAFVVVTQTHIQKKINAQTAELSDCGMPSEEDSQE